MTAEREILLSLGITQNGSVHPGEGGFYMMSVKHTPIPHEATPTRLIDEEEALSITVALWGPETGILYQPDQPEWSSIIVWHQTYHQEPSSGPPAIFWLVAICNQGSAGSFSWRSQYSETISSELRTAKLSYVLYPERL